MKNILIAFLLILMVNSLFAQDDVTQANWVDHPVKVDGKVDEWNKPLQLYDFGTKLFFAFANDDKNIYICFQTAEEMNQSKIIRAGMKVTLSQKGKSKVSIIYPMASSTSQPVAVPDKTSDYKTTQAILRNNFLVQNSMMEVKGFRSRNAIIPINDSSGINVFINWDDANKLNYEIAIPLNEFFGDHYTKEDLSKPISMTMEVNAITRQGRSNDITMGGMGSGGRGMGGGKHHEGNHNTTSDAYSPQGGSEAERANMYQKATMKQDFMLASKK